MQAIHNAFPVLDEMLHASVASTVGSVLERLVVAAALGGVIGIERERKHRPAGLRTNMFMCFGAAMFTMLSMLMAGPGGQDQTRIAAQIISGIGFIGAGSILHPRGGVVRGVTTAATIFVVAAIGMCTGAGLMIPAALATALVLFGLLILGLIEIHIFVRPYPAVYQVSGDSTPELFTLLELARESRRSRLIDVKFSSAPPASQVEFTLEAQPEIHQKLRQKLRDEFEKHKIISFSSSEQE
jgi:putative Mg2+ transporter-C (MgtC) family protein